MSELSPMVLQGTIVGITKRQIRPRQGGKKFDPFTVYTYFVVGEGKRSPVAIRSTENGRQVGDEVEIPFYIKPWQTEKSSGYELREATSRD